jgi:hypothetical protein
MFHASAHLIKIISAPARQNSAGQPDRKSGNKTSSAKKMTRTKIPNYLTVRTGQLYCIRVNGYRNSRHLTKVFQEPYLQLSKASSIMADWANEGKAPAPTHSEKPDWLKNDTENPLAKDWATVPVEVNAGVGTLTPVTADTSPPDDGSADGKCSKLFLFGMSALFLAFFIYATIDEKKQNGSRLQYVIFNGTSAGLPVLFLCHWMICFPEKPIYFLSTGMFVWGTVLMVMVCLDFKELDEDSEERPERIYEISVIVVSLFSSLYHPCVMKCCLTKG